MTYPSILQLALCNYITTATGVVVNEGYLNIPRLKKFFVMSQIAERYEYIESIGDGIETYRKTVVYKTFVI